MAGGTDGGTPVMHQPWRADEQFSDIVLVENQAGRSLGGDGVRTSLLVDESSRRDSRGIAAGVVLALGQIRRIDRDAVVGFVPSLAHAAHLAQFDWALERAYEVASEHPRRIVVAGSVPDGHDVEGEALVLNPFGRFPHVSAAHLSPGRRQWRPASMTAGTIDAFRSGLLGIDPSLAAMVDAIASSSSIRGEARILREAGRTALLSLPSFGTARARQACLLVPVSHGGLKK